MDLLELAAELEKDGYDCAILEEDRPVLPHLQVYLGADAQSRERILTLTMVDSLYGDPLLMGEEGGWRPFVHLQFQVNISGTIQDAALLDLGSLLHYLNSNLELPGFVLHEGREVVFYRYVHLAVKGQEDLTLIKAIIGTVALQMELFEGIIRQVASGDHSFDEVINLLLAQAEGNQ